MDSETRQRPLNEAGRWEGTVAAVHLCVGSYLPMQPVAEALAREDYGLEGDRHARAGSSRQVLLIDAETLADLDLAPGQVRENLTTRGLALQQLPPGTRLRVGAALLEITKPCEPCSRMDEIRPGLQAALAGRRGVLARVVASGAIRPGDAIVRASG